MSNYNNNMSNNNDGVMNDDFAFMLKDTGLYTQLQTVYNNMDRYFMSPVVLVIVLVLFFVYAFTVFNLGETGQTPYTSITGNTTIRGSSSFFGEGGMSTMNIMIVVGIVIALFYVSQNMSIFQEILAWMNQEAKQEDNKEQQKQKPSETKQKPSETKQKPPPPTIAGMLQEVFNIPSNTHTYEDAKAVCSAYGGRLATYKEVEDAYNSGGEWCNYGWSDGQMALFPTQQTTFDGLQKISGHENDCGRPGVNGGYMSNANLTFGVNCFGRKPEMTKEEEELMATQPHYPLTENDINMEKRVNYWKNNLSQILVSPFNYTSWSKM